MGSLEEALARWPRVELTRTPTPLQRLDHLGRQLGLELWLKRDDLTDLALGGDKPRKLEYELARAVEAGADVLVTCGSAQSNFARLATAAARRLGMDCALVLSRDRHPVLQGNLLLVKLMGADVRLVDVPDHWELEHHVDKLADELRQRGRHPYVIPVSGSTEVSCLGYVRAGLELADQLRAAGVVPDGVYAPFGTGGIFTALLLALRDQGIATPVIGISVNRPAAVCRQQVDHWWSRLCALLEVNPQPLRGTYEIDDSYIGSEYGDPTPAALEAICRLAETEGILADPVYSGKVLAGLIDQVAVRWTRGERIVMLHSGGVPAVFAYHAELERHLRLSGRVTSS